MLRLPKKALHVSGFFSSLRRILSGLRVGCLLILACLTAPVDAVATENLCDLLAAAPTDPQKVIQGIAYDALNPAAAIPACEEAVRNFPSVDRFKFQLARALNKAGRFAEAVDLYQALSTSGYLPAIYNLVVLYSDGHGIGKDEAKAFELLGAAANGGFSLAQNELGMRYAQGKYVAQDYAQARDWFERATKQNNSDAANSLGFLFEKGLGGERDLLGAKSLFLKSAAQGNHPAEFNLSELYRQGLGVPEDQTESVRWLMLSAEGRYPSAMNDLGVAYQQARGMERDYAKALEWFKRAAQQGLRIAQTNLGKTYAGGLGVPADRSTAAEWYARSAEQGDAWAQNELGVYFQNGTGVPKDSRRAVELYRKSAEQGFDVAQVNLAWAFMNGIGVEQNFSEAARWFAVAGEKGNAGARDKLGTLYRDGKGVSQDDAKAVDLFRAAAQQGLPDAQVDLGYMYAAGRGVAKDGAEAAKWFEAAATAGNGFAMAQLAWLNRFSSEIVHSDLRAYVWYRLALKAGYNDVDVELGELLFKSFSRRGGSKGGIGLKNLAGDEVEKIASAYPELVKHAQELTRAGGLSEAVELLRTAADGGSVQAMLDLGNLYYFEDPALAVPLPEFLPSQPFKGGSFAEARNWFQRAVNAGSAAARINLGVMYELGRGINQDLARARALYQQALKSKQDGASILGSLRLSFEEIWAEEQSEVLANDDPILQDVFGSPPEANDITIEPLKNFARLVVTDGQGRRFFYGNLNPDQPFRIPRDRNDLILWPIFFSNQMQVRFGNQIIKIPDDAAAIRLDRRILSSKQNAIIPEKYSDQHALHLPDDFNFPSHIKIVAASGANLYVHDPEQIFGFETSPHNDQTFSLPDIAGLALTLRPSDRETEKSQIKVSVDGRQVLALLAPTGCWVSAKLDPAALRRISKTVVLRKDCLGIAEGKREPFLVDQQGRIVAEVQPQPDERVTWVPEGSMHLNQGMARLHLTLGGRWDERYRADKIFLDWSLREEGANSFETIGNQIDLADSEIALGLISQARTRLDDALARANALGSVPIGLKINLLWSYGSMLQISGRYYEAQRFFLQGYQAQRRINVFQGKVPDLSTGRFLAGLKETYAHLGDAERVLAYELHLFLLQQETSLERSDEYSSEVNASVLVEIIDRLHTLGRNKDAALLLPFAHQEAKRDIARDFSEPLKFPLDLRPIEQTTGPIDRSETAAGALAVLGRVYSLQGRHAEALPIFEQWKKTRTNIFGAGHPGVAVAISKLIDEEVAIGDRTTAISLGTQNFGSLTQFLDARSAISQPVRAGADALLAATSSLLQALYDETDPQATIARRGEAFEVVQRAQNSSAARALQLAGARLAEKDPSKRDSMRRYQDLEDELAQSDVRLLNAVLNKAPTDQIEQIRRKSETAHRALEQFGAGSKEKKELGQLATDVIVPYDLMRDHIRPDEAVLSFQPGAASTFVFVATRVGLHWFRANIGLYELQTGIAELRCGVDPQMPLGRSRSFCRRATNSSDADGPVPFALGTAHRLYDNLLGPARQLIEGKGLIFVLSGPMSALQPNLLAENVPLHPMASKAEDFEGAGWLPEKHAISVVPAVSSFVALRSRNDPGRGGNSQRFEGAYLGLGNPALTGTPACPRTRIPDRCSQLIEVAANQTDTTSKRAFAVPARTYVGSGLANVQAIRAICPLPETEVEIRCVVESLGGANHRVIFGERLTESDLKRLPLERYKIIHFATHALLAEEVMQLGSSDAEPALVLTPPRLATGDDDGLLKASEIAQLRLDADLVILSACSTAASGSLESDALSGLARAFFYAGARSLLVSYWPVDSAATVVLITRTFNRLKGDRNIGRAEALRLAMVSMMSDPKFAHPSKWAPFALIGEDGLPK